MLYGTFAVILDVLLPDVPYGIAIEDGGELVALVLVLMASLSWYRALNASGPTASGP